MEGSGESGEESEEEDESEEEESEEDESEEESEEEEDEEEAEEDEYLDVGAERVAALRVGSSGDEGGEDDEEDFETDGEDAPAAPAPPRRDAEARDEEDEDAIEEARDADGPGSSSAAAEASFAAMLEDGGPQDETQSRALVAVDGERGLEPVSGAAENNGDNAGAVALAAAAGGAPVVNASISRAGRAEQAIADEGDSEGEDEDRDFAIGGELYEDLMEESFGAHDLLSLNHLRVNHVRTLCSMEDIAYGGNKKMLLLKLQRKLKNDLPATWTRWVCGEDPSAPRLSSMPPDDGSGMIVGPRRTDGATCVYNKMIYYHGGSFNGHSMNSMVRRDPETSIWYLVQPINKQLNAEFASEKSGEIVARDLKAYTGPSPRRYHTAVVYGDRLWVYGGTGDESEPKSDMHYYSFKDNVWVQEEYVQVDVEVPADEGKKGKGRAWGKMAKLFGKKKKKVRRSIKAPKRYFHEALVYKNKMIVHGGIDDMHRFSNEVFLYHLDEARWEKVETTGARPAESGVCHATIWKTDMYSLRFSQSRGFMEMNRLDLRTLEWTAIDVRSHCEPGLRFHESFRTAFAMAQHGKFWVMHAGKDKGGRLLGDTYAFDLVNQRWTAVRAEGFAGFPRAHHSMVSVHSGAGGAAELYVVAGKGVYRQKTGTNEPAVSPPALKDEYFTSAPAPPPATHVTTNSQLINMLKSYCGANSAGYEPVPLSDCTIICQDQEMPAHRIVLASQSPVFRDFFRPGTPEFETGQVEIEGFDVGTGAAPARPRPRNPAGAPGAALTATRVPSDPSQCNRS